MSMASAPMTAAAPSDASMTRRRSLRRFVCMVVMVPFLRSTGRGSALSKICPLCAGDGGGIDAAEPFLRGRVIMDLRDFLQGKWMKHPLHPAIVSIPVGLWSMALVFDLLSRAGDGNVTFVRTSFYCILVGLVGALVAVPTGVADWSGIKPETPAWRTGFYHLTLNVVI